MDLRGLRVIQKAYFLLLTHTMQLLLVSFCDTTGDELKCDILTHVHMDIRITVQCPKMILNNIENNF